MVRAERRALRVLGRVFWLLRVRGRVRRVRATALSCVPRCTMINDNVIHNSPQALAERADGTLFSVRGPGGARTQRRSGYVAEPRGAPRAPEVPKT